MMAGPRLIVVAGHTQVPADSLEDLGVVVDDSGLQVWPSAHWTVRRVMSTGPIPPARRSICKVRPTPASRSDIVLVGGLGVYHESKNAV
jgi:hypothetical protein